jgi:hypothetical protein
MLRCSMTGMPLNSPSDGIYDDGEWISWDWINEQIYEQELRNEYPKIDPEVARIFEDLVEVARSYYVTTGRFLQIWGELGELYAEVKHGLKRNRVHAPGADGRLGDDHVEVKTMSPERSGDAVEVKRSGNFNKLLVVKIDKDYRFQSRMIDRSSLKKGSGKQVRVKWSSN